MTSTHTATVSKDIVVDAPIEEAFRVFTARFGDFKPREHNLLGAPITETVFEPEVGGHIFDRAEDGSECHWARILAYEPPSRVLFSWDIGPTWQLEQDPDNASEWRFASRPTARHARESSSSIDISTVTAPAGKVSAKASRAIRAGRSTSSGTPN